MKAKVHNEKLHVIKDLKTLEFVASKQIFKLAK